MKKLLWLFLYISSLSHIESANMQKFGEINFTSDLAGYDGKNLQLNGNVSIDHPLGRISSGIASVTSSHTINDEPYQILKLKEDVNIALSKGSKLHCHFGDINTKTLTCIFAGDPPDNHVVYTDEYYDKDNNIIPVELKCFNMNVKLSQKPEANTKVSKYFISNIFAQNNVSLKYGKDLLAIADQAIYHRIKSDNSDDKHFSGLIFLQPIGERGTCKLKNNFNDYVEAKEISVDTLHQSVNCLQAKGEVALINHNLNENNLSFSSQNISWDTIFNALTFKNDIILNHPKAGTLSCDGEIVLYRNHSNKGNSWNRILSSGNTIWDYSDKKNSIKRTLTCHKTVLIDLLDNTVIMNSPENNGESVNPLQIVYNDYYGEIRSDSLTMKYTIKDSLQPQQIVLKGNVQVIKNISTENKQKNNILQYAIADKAEYFPDEKIVILSANNRNRVLFFDKVNNIQVSADAIKVKRDESSGKESISSQGNVRFSFNDDEFLKLTKNFNIN